MPMFNAGGLNNAQSQEELTDALIALKRQLEYLLNGNLSSDNITEIGGWYVSQTALYSKDQSVGLYTDFPGSSEGRGFLVKDAVGNPRVIVGNYDTNKYGIVLMSPTAVTVLNEYGFNPQYIKNYKNLAYNSSFERFDPDTLKPTCWNVSSGVVTNVDASFFGSRSLKMPAGSTAEQKDSETILGIEFFIPPRPDWWGRKPIRVSFLKKLGGVMVEVKSDIGNLLITKPDGTTATSWTLPYNADWDTGRVSFSAAVSTAAKVWLKFTNTDTVDGYIDAVQIEPDFTGMWPSFYTDGPQSTEIEVGTAVGGEFMEYISSAWNPAGVTFTLANGYTAEPVAVTSVSGVPAEFATASYVLVIEHIQETVGTTPNCYSKIKVTPKGSSVPTAPTGAKITIQAVCSGKVVR